eukprot:scaffold152512_cov41-Tisochrysis_lutea.AAC.1
MYKRKERMESAQTAASKMLPKSDQKAARSSTIRSAVSHTIPKDPHHLDNGGGEQRDVEQADRARVEQPRRDCLQVLFLRHILAEGGGGATYPPG